MEVHEVRAPGFECHFSKNSGISITVYFGLMSKCTVPAAAISELLKCWSRMLLMDYLVMDLCVITLSRWYTKFSHKTWGPKDAENLWCNPYTMFFMTLLVFVFQLLWKL